MLIKVLQSLVPCVEGVPNETHQHECWVWRFLEHALPIDRLPCKAYSFVKELGLSCGQMFVRMVRNDGATVDITNKVDGDEVERKIGFS